MQFACKFAMHLLHWRPLVMCNKNADSRPFDLSVGEARCHEKWSRRFLNGSTIVLRPMEWRRLVS